MHTHIGMSGGEGRRRRRRLKAHTHTRTHTRTHTFRLRPPGGEGREAKNVEEGERQQKDRERNKMGRQEHETSNEDAVCILTTCGRNTNVCFASNFVLNKNVQPSKLDSPPLFLFFRTRSRVAHIPCLSAAQKRKEGRKEETETRSRHFSTSVLRPRLEAHLSADRCRQDLSTGPGASTNSSQAGSPPATNFVSDAKHYKQVISPLAPGQGSGSGFKIRRTSPLSGSRSGRTVRSALRVGIIIRDTKLSLRG